jgi:hypothetical protein
MAPKIELLKGLEILARALDLSAVDAKEAAQRVHAFLEELSGKIPTAPRPRPLSDSFDAQNWKDEALRILDESTALAPALPEASTEYINLAWENWFQRIQDAKPLPNFEAIICEAAKQGPARFLRFPPTSMTAREWSVAFYQAVAGGRGRTNLRPWLSVAALQELGFLESVRAITGPDSHTLRNLFAYDLKSDELKQIQMWKPRGLPSGGQPVSAVIVNEEGSNSNSWRPSANFASLVLRSAEVVGLKKVWEQRQAESLESLRLSWLIFDLSVFKEPKVRKPILSSLPFPLLSFGHADTICNFLQPAARVGTAVILPPDLSEELPPPYVSIRSASSFDDVRNQLPQERSSNK